MATSTPTTMGHVLMVGAGAVAGAAILAPAAVALAPVLGLGVVATMITPGLGALVGGYLGHVFGAPAPAAA